MKTATYVIGAAALLGSLVDVSANKALMELIAQDAERLTREGFFQDEKPPSVLGQPADCVDDKVTIGGEVFDCREVDFYSYLSLADLEIPELGHPVQFRSMDIWGWVGPSGREFTLICLDNGAAIVDSSDPANPCIVGKLPTGRFPDRWGDIKVYDNTMYAVKDKGGSEIPGEELYGIEVYDLLRYDAMECAEDPKEAPYFYPDFVNEEHGSSHNLAINTESGYLYSVGTNFCEGGLMVFDVKTDRLRPSLVACIDQDGYTHDAQCVTYDGPDLDHQGKEICFAFNEDTVTVWDLTDFQNPVVLSRSPYINSAYTHQGWTNNDLTKVLVDDELDEFCNQEPFPEATCDRFPLNNLTGIKTTSTVVFDISDLDDLKYEGAYIHPDLSIDHNLYIWGLNHRKGWGGNPPLEFYPDPNFAYLNNYLAGVRILDISSDDIADWSEVGYFDVSPDRTEVAFAGSWSGYMHPSGVYAVSSIERGLFLIQPRMAFTPDFPPPPAPSPTTDPGDGGDGGSDDGDNFVEIAAVILLVSALIIAFFALAIIIMNIGSISGKKAATQEVVTAKSLA